MRTLLSLLLLLAAGCQEETALQCPANTALIGQYALKFTASHDAGECIADGGLDGGQVILTPLTVDNVGTKGATFCSAPSLDGGIELQLLVAGKGGVRKSPLLDDGGFHFVSDTTVAQGTACICDVSDSETMDGFLLTTGPFALRPDGGLPVVTSIAATLTDQLVAASQGCICNVPCSVTYSLSGGSF
ncbi:MAG TPA: hypothetical protein VMK66_18495 [Myxococcales bacterium]|nr:hypothetical protein [Myxococcales bacterium]